MPFCRATSSVTGDLNNPSVLQNVCCPFSIISAHLQAQERADNETREANAMQAQYETAWSNAEATHAQGRQLLDSLTKVSCSCQRLLLTNDRMIPHGSWDSMSPNEGLVCCVKVTMQPHMQNKSSSFFMRRRHISACCRGWHEGVG